MASARLQDLPRAGPVRVLVAAASSVVRAGLEAVVASSPALASVGACATAAEELIAALRSREPDVLLLAADLTGAEEWLDDSGVGVVLLSDHPPPDGRGAGRAFLPATATVDEIGAAVLGAAAGLIVLHPELALASERGEAWARWDGVSPQPLSAREIEVLRMLAEGLSNKAIADRLKISDHTVKFHLSSIFNKLNVSTRTEAVTTGARLGLILL